LRLLIGELLLGEHTLVPELAQLLQLVDRRGAGGRGLRGLVSSCVLLGPFPFLAPAHATCDGGCRPGDGRRATHPSQQSWHLERSSQTVSAASSAASMAWMGMRPL